ncbi:MAG: flippase [Balneolales bacterium]|nr:flippase [Balneolales bacterium]
MATYSKTNILKSSAWIAAYRMIRMVLAFVVGIFVARYLGPSLYGQLSYSVALVMIFLGVAGPGMKDVITQKLDECKDETDKAGLLYASFRLMFIINAALLVATVLVAILLRPDDRLIWALVAIIGLGNVFRACESFELYFLYRLEMSRTVLIQAGSFLITAILKLILIWLAADLIWFGIAVGAELLITGAGFWLTYKTRKNQNKPILVWSLYYRKVIHVLKISVPAIGALGFTLMLFKADQVMLGWLAGDAATGFYAIAAQFSEYWLYLAAAVVTSMYPNLLNAKNKDLSEGTSGFKKQFITLCSLLIYSAILLQLLVYFTGNHIIIFFLGDSFVNSAEILRVHIWSLVFIFLLEALKKWFVIENLLSKYFTIMAIAAISNIGINLILIPEFGGIGAAWATVFAYGLAGFAGVFIFKSSREAGYLILKGALHPWKKISRTFYS